MMQIRRARPDDYRTLAGMELRCFDEARRESPRVLRASLGNPLHEVWLLEEEAAARAALFLRLRRKSLRVHSIAVVPEARARGLGRHLMQFATKRASARGLREVRLEADAGDPGLVAWYEGFGFRPAGLLPAYYGPRRHGLRMRLTLPD